MRVGIHLPHIGRKAGPDAIRPRPDEVRPWPLAFGPKEMAPAFRDGFFVVPRLGAFDEAEEGR